MDKLLNFPPDCVGCDYATAYPAHAKCHGCVRMYNDHHSNPKPKPEALTVEQLAIAYLKLCDNDCVGDSSVGIAPCIFWEWLDVDENDNLVENGCKLLVYDRMLEED